ncbi:MAG TPA: ABC transporter permease [Terriglobia bacterium]|nr:ABC transporter permease [Terriglobia bacterium]
MLSERISALWLRMKALVRRRELDRDLDDELQFHLAMREQKLREQGVAAEEAPYAARRQFGNVTRLKETSRELWDFRWLETFAQDLRYGARLLRKNPGFTAVAVLTLAFGIGANTAIFSLIDVVLFRPLPIRRPSEVVRICGGKTRGEAYWRTNSYPSYLEYRDNTDIFAGLAAYIDRFPVNISAGKLGTERAVAGMVTGYYFPTLGVEATRGRTIAPEDDRLGAPPVAMLSHDFCRRHFSSDTSVLGMTVLIDGQLFSVVGVTPAGFGGVSFENLPEVWLPMSYGLQLDPLLKSQIPLGSRSFSPFGIVGRLKPGISIAQAQAQLNILGDRFGAGKPEPGEDSDFARPWPVLASATEVARADRAHYSFLVLGIVLLVLLIACSDAAGLLLVRAEGRQKEFAVRMALGATRLGIIRLHLIEGLVIAALGAAAGCALAAWGTWLLVASAPPILPIPLERSTSILDIRVLTFTMLAAVLAGVVSSIAPALRYSRSDSVLAMKGDFGSTPTFSQKLSLQNLFVVFQLAASVILLVGAGLMIRTLRQASHVRLGFDPDHTVAASTDPIRQGYDKAGAAALIDPLLDALRAQPGVQSAALGSLPLQPWMGTTVTLEGHHASKSEGVWVSLNRTSPGYFGTLGIPLLVGRDFTRSDGEKAPGVAIVSDGMVKRYWPDQSPLGKHIGHLGLRNATFEVVGVVGDIAPRDLRKEPERVVYFPLAQTYLMFPWQPDITLLARAKGDPRSLVPSIRAAVSSVNPNLPIFHVRTLREQVASTFAEERFLARLLLAFALLATILSAAGVYGLVSYTTERSMHEFGIRMALGARPRDVLRMVLRKGFLLALSGLAVGLVVASGLARLLASLLFGVAQTDSITFAAVSFLLACVSLTACYLPARRATKVDPLVALRYE